MSTSTHVTIAITSAAEIVLLLFVFYRSMNTIHEERVAQNFSGGLMFRIVSGLFVFILLDLPLMLGLLSLHDNRLAVFATIFVLFDVILSEKRMRKLLQDREIKPPSLMSDLSRQFFYAVYVCLYGFLLVQALLPNAIP